MEKVKKNFIYLCCFAAVGKSGHNYKLFMNAQSQIVVQKEARMNWRQFDLIDSNLRAEGSDYTDTTRGNEFAS